MLAWLTRTNTSELEITPTLPARMVRFRRSYVFVLATFPSPLSNLQFKARLKGLDRGQWSFSAVIMRLQPVGPAAFLGGHEERRESMKQTSGSAGFSAVTMSKTSCAMRFFLGPNEQPRNAGL